MWLSLNILKELVDIEGLTAEEIGLKLTMSSAEIDGIKYVNNHFKSIVTCRLLEVKKMPDSDHLTLVKADTGSEIFDVVCGAPNHKTGDIAALALPGTKFSEEFVIKKTKIRGHESTGMLCSLRELGLSEDHSGIIIFPSETKIGVPLSEIYKDWVDIHFEIDNKSITHRPDLWGHIGFAREIAAIFGRKTIDPVNESLAKDFKKFEELSVSIECPNQAPRYCALTVKNIKIQESPEWLKARVTSIGMRPINNIVDITNYVMAEIGQPMHAFDRKKLTGDMILVRMASSGETLTTLDGKKHELTSEDIVIADKSGPIALAGVMGGGNSEIDDSTTEIVLESANFNPVNIRKTAQRFSLRTDAAIRFEKSLDPEMCSRALIRCFDLIKKIIPDAEPVTEMIDCYPVKFPVVSIETSTDKINRALGTDLSGEKIKKILTALGFIVDGDNGFKVKVPSYRSTKDISIPADLNEEVGRIFGYDNILPIAPMVVCAPPLPNEKRSLERQVKTILSRNHNMVEVYNYSFVGEDLLNKSGVNLDKELRLKNPLSRDHDRLRTSMVPGLLNNIVYNAKNFQDFRIYELRRVYNKNDRTSKELALENVRVTGLIYNSEMVSKDGDILFYEAKAVVKDLINQLRIKKVQFLVGTRDIPPYAHSMRVLRIVIEGKEAGLIFDLNPKTKASFEIKGSASFFDIDMDILLSCSKEPVKFFELQKYPEVPFEVTVIADKKTNADTVLEIARRADKLVKTTNVVSVYEGNPIPEDKKSISIRSVFGSNERTLSSGEIDELQKKLISALEKKGFKLR